MYAFRKPFNAATYEGQSIGGLHFKSALVVAQLVGYLISKFIGIRVISEMPAGRRAIAIVGLIAAAEAALVGFAFALSPAAKVAMLFLNGLPLGMVFGLVLSYLEGRQATEALSAALCASFICSSGAVKTVGRYLIEVRGVDEFAMPMWVGLIFTAPLLFCVWLLQRTPPPSEVDRRMRSERKEMTGPQRRAFVAAYWPGLALLVAVYMALTVVRTIRDDFGVEIWADLGVREEPSIYATSETVVALVVVAFNALAIFIAHNVAAIRATTALMCGSFLLVGGSATMQAAGLATPFGFMVACGVGMYIPYVAFHTTIFERLIAASGKACNLGFLMYLADALGYLAYAVALAFAARFGNPDLAVFRWALWIAAGFSILALLAALLYFQRVLAPVREEKPARFEEYVPAN